MRRLFSTFARGWPGIGLLIMRVGVGAAVLAGGLGRWPADLSFIPVILDSLAVTAGILMILGLWTPLAGAIAAITQIWAAFAQPGDADTKILLAALGIGLAMVGPGAWSIDARLFGWKRLDFHDDSR